MTREEAVKHLQWNAFLAMTRYELLWNIRKKKFFGVLVVAFVFATLILLPPVIVSNVMNKPLEAYPNYVIETGTGIGQFGFGFLLFAIVTAMNSISGEFESGSIVPLLTKPISRTIVFLGKAFASFLTLLVTYIVLIIYNAVGGTILYGPQNYLHLLPLTLLGSLISTFVWIEIVLALGALSKSSMIAALGTFGIWMTAKIVTGIALFSGQAWISCLAGSEAAGHVSDIGSQIPGVAFIGKRISTGTDAVAANLANFALFPSAEVKFSTSGGFLYTEALGIILLRSILVALVYICAFSVVAWHAFRRAEVKERKKPKKRGNGSVKQKIILPPSHARKV